MSKGLLESLLDRIDDLEKKLVDAKPRPMWVTVDAYAAERSISTSTVYAAVKAGRLEARQYGETVNIHEKSERRERHFGQRRGLRVRADVEIGRPVRVERIGTDDTSWAARVKAGGRR